MGNYVKTDKRTYLNLDNGTSLGVKEARHGGEWRVVSVSSDGSTQLYVLQSGYASADEAQTCLDEMMESMGGSVLTLNPPTRPEELSEEE